MPVQSYEVDDWAAPRQAQGAEQTQRKQRRRGGGLDPSGLALSALGSLISAAGWAIGAKYTIDGVLALTNALLRFLTIPYQAPIPPDWTLYLFLAPLPIAFSLVEWNQLPFRRDVEGYWEFAPAATWVVWGIVVAMDAVTTFTGLGVPPGEDAPRILQQLATSTVGKGVVTAILTAGPEWLLRAMLRAFRRAWRTRKKG